MQLCRRIKDDLISDVLLGNPIHRRDIVGLSAMTYFVWTLGAVKKTCQEWWMMAADDDGRKTLFSEKSNKENWF